MRLTAASFFPRRDLKSKVARLPYLASAPAPLWGAGGGEGWGGGGGALESARIKGDLKKTQSAGAELCEILLEFQKQLLD